MKISRVLFFICLALAASGCHQRSDDAVPAGSFRLVVEDMVKDETFRVASLKVLSSQPGMLSVSKERAHSACQLLIPAGQKLREGQMFLIASKATDSRTTNAYILVSLQMKVEGGDGGMIVQASAHTGLGSTTFYPPKDTELEVICNLTAKSGVYPLDAPLEIGRVDGKPMILTVGKPFVCQLCGHDRFKVGKGGVIIGLHSLACAECGHLEFFEATPPILDDNAA